MSWTKRELALLYVYSTTIFKRNREPIFIAQFTVLYMSFTHVAEGIYTSVSTKYEPL